MKYEDVFMACHMRLSPPNESKYARLKPGPPEAQKMSTPCSWSMGIHNESRALNHEMATKNLNFLPWIASADCVPGG